MITNLKLTFEDETNKYEFQFGTHVKVNDIEYLDLKKPESKILEIRKNIDQLLKELIQDEQV